MYICTYVEREESSFKIRETMLGMKRYPKQFVLLKVVHEIQCNDDILEEKEIYFAKTGFRKEVYVSL